MDLAILIESWDRQAQIFNNLAGLVNDGNKKAKPSDDGMTLIEQLCHIHECRYYWLGHVSPEHQAGLGDVYVEEGGEWRAIDNLPEVQKQLTISAAAIKEAVTKTTEEGKEKVGPYSHPAFFLQHMIWHEGYTPPFSSSASETRARSPARSGRRKTSGGSGAPSIGCRS